MEELLFDTIVDDMRNNGIDLAYVEKIILGQSYDAESGKIESVALIYVSKLQYLKNGLNKMKMDSTRLEIWYVGEKSASPISRSALCKMKPDKQEKIKSKI